MTPYQFNYLASIFYRDVANDAVMEYQYSLLCDGRPFSEEKKAYEYLVNHGYIVNTIGSAYLNIITRKGKSYVIDHLPQDQRREVFSWISFGELWMIYQHGSYTNG